MKSLKLAKDITWVGSLDPNLRVFDIIMETEFGTTYNSYVVKGSKKTALFETVKAKFFAEYLEKLKEILGDISKIDYIVVDHTEPDHAGSVEMLLNLVPSLKIVGSDAAIEFLREIVNRDFDSIIVKHGDTLDLGNKTLKFISAPFLHWPDSIYTYIPEDRFLFTCDSFGSHYSFEDVLYSKIPDEKKNDYMSALLYYYTAIFGPFKKYVLEAIEKIKDFNIEVICTGHGPVLDKNPREIIDIYEKWSKTENKNLKKTIIMPYVAAYGYTGQLAQSIKNGISEAGDFDVNIYEINIANYAKLKSEIMYEIEHADGILLGTSTINGDALPLIWDIAVSLNPIVHGGKYASAFGSYGWSGEGVPNIIARLDQLRLNVIDGLKIRFKPSPDDINSAFEFGKKFAEAILSGKLPPRENEKYEDISSIAALNPSGKIVKWKCTVCGEIFEGVYPPKVCPACGVGQEMFVILEDESAIYKSETPLRILIAGSGAAGISAAESARKRNSTAYIEIISAESELPYYRPSLSDYLAGIISEESLLIKPQSWYDDNNITLNLGKQITGFDTKMKTVTLSDGSSLKYDKLILATGSRCALPPINNIHKYGVFTMRSKDDAKQINKFALKSRKAVIVGGGVLGLEIAHALKILGLEIEVVEADVRVLPRQLDSGGSDFFEVILKNAGVIIHKNHFVKNIIGEEKCTGVELENGKFIAADLVIISAGIKPNKEMPSEMGIRTNRGIIVNNKMETSSPDIYACGDAVEYDGIVIGLWSPALDQGKVAGANAVGDNEIYSPLSHPVTFDGLGTKIFSMGDLGTMDELYQISEFTDVKNGIYKKLYFKNTVFTGGILIGDVSKSSVIMNGVRNKDKIEKVVKALI